MTNHNFVSFKGRMVAFMQEVEVYRNLHRNCWSIRDAKSKLVLGYADDVTLSDAYFVVNESGRQRVLRDKKKNVHAFVRGRILFTDVPCTGTKVTYNPYKFGSFVTVHDDCFLDIQHAMNATLTSDMEVYV